VNEILTLDVTVSFWDVDREQHLLLAAIFKILQEAAIKHADQSDAGARAIVARGETWVLHRMTAHLNRYPRYEERLRVETWSSGIRAFRGYRDFRVFCGEELVLSASSLWLYVNALTKSLVRVPAPIAAAFPSRPEAVFRPDLDRLKLIPPDAAAAPACPISVRYSDLDGNGHVNNTAYVDYLQTALSRANLPRRPADMEIQFLREIPPDADAVNVSLERRGATTAFAIAGPDALFAQGQVA
jgi:acyl-ACP thioesterase